MNKKGKAYQRVQAKLKHARLTVLDEYNMIGRMFLGKVDYRAEEALAHRSKERMRGHHVSMGGLDVVLAGHSAQAKPKAGQGKTPKANIVLERRATALDCEQEEVGSVVHTICVWSGMCTLVQLCPCSDYLIQMNKMQL